MVKYLSDIALSLSLLLGSVYLWFVADAIPTFARYQNVDSDFWPKALLIIIGVLAMGLLYQSIAAAKLRHKERSVAEIAEPSDKSPNSWKKLLLVVFLVFAYFWGLRLLGFLIATVIFLSFAVHLANYSNRLIKILFPFVFTGIITVIFAKLLSLPLPRGAGIFYDISLFFY